MRLKIEGDLKKLSWAFMTKKPLFYIAIIQYLLHDAFTAQM